MDEIILIEAVERYLRGEMSSQERSFFEEMRKNDPAIDQLVVENIYLLQGLDKFGETKAFKHLLLQTESTMMQEGVIKEPSVKGTAKVVQLWNRYRKSMAVAASIALFISVLTAGLNIAYTKKYRDVNYEVLRGEITRTKIEINSIKNKSNAQNVPVRPEPKVDYRGTGFLIDGKGYLVTNLHVISQMKNIYVENDKGDYYTAQPVYADNSADLAIIKITDTSYKSVTNLPYSIKRSNSDLGEQFFTLGFPRNEIVYGEGYVSAKSGNDGDSLAYQLTVSANPGNSGGPVINRNGEIIGIITGKDIKADGVVYATKSKNIFKMIEELKKTDTASSIKVPAGNGLKAMERVAQVKKMEEFVFMVVGSQ